MLFFSATAWILCPLPSATRGGRADQGSSSDVGLRSALENVFRGIALLAGAYALTERHRVSGGSGEDGLDLEVDGLEERVGRLRLAGCAHSAAPPVCRRTFRFIDASGPR